MTAFPMGISFTPWVTGDPIVVKGLNTDIRGHSSGGATPGQARANALVKKPLPWSLPCQNSLSSSTARGQSNRTYKNFYVYSHGFATA